jgi:hypothetical protein
VDFYSCSLIPLLETRLHIGSRVLFEIWGESVGETPDIEKNVNDAALYWRPPVHQFNASLDPKGILLFFIYSGSHGCGSSSHLRLFQSDVTPQVVLQPSNHVTLYRPHKNEGQSILNRTVRY